MILNTKTRRPARSLQECKTHQLLSCFISKLLIQFLKWEEHVTSHQIDKVLHYLCCQSLHDTLVSWCCLYTIHTYLYTLKKRKNNTPIFHFHKDEKIKGR